MSDGTDREYPPACLRCGRAKADDESYVCGACVDFYSEWRAVADRWDAEHPLPETEAQRLTRDVSRLSAEVDRLRAERDEQVRVNGFLVGRGKEQDIIRDRLSAEAAEERHARERLSVALETASEDLVVLDGERDGLRGALETLGEWAGDAVQVGEDGPSCRACGCELDDNGHGHSSCAVPLVNDALNALSTPTGTRARAVAAAENPKAEAVAVPPVTEEGAP